MNQGRTTINHARVDLHQAGARVQLGPGLAAVGDAASGNDGELIGQCFGQGCDHGGGLFEDWGAGQAAGLVTRV